MGQLEKESRLRDRAGVGGEPCGAAEDGGLCAHGGRGDRGCRAARVRSGPSCPAVSSCLRLSVIEARLKGRSQALKEEPALSLPSGVDWMGTGSRESVGP